MGYYLAVLGRYLLLDPLFEVDKVVFVLLDVCHEVILKFGVLMFIETMHNSLLGASGLVVDYVPKIDPEQLIRLR